jgi:polyisoprenoid-binding protein YceI
VKAQGSRKQNARQPDKEGRITVTNRLAGFALAVLAGALSVPAFAQSGNWQVEANRSAARISIEDKAAAGNISLVLGGANVRGSLRLDNADVSKSTVEFTVYQAGSNAQEPNKENDTRNGRQDGNDPQSTAPATLLSFRSHTASWTSDGNLKVSGILTVTHVDYQEELNANEAYSGPVYTERVVSQASREEVLEFTFPSSYPADLNGKIAADVSTSLIVHREDFPELVNALLSTNWPAVAQDQACEQAPAASEDYSGAACTGSQVIVPSNTRTVAAASEDYPGDSGQSVKPGNIVSVALHLHLAQQGALSAKTGGQ